MYPLLCYVHIFISIDEVFDEVTLQRAYKIKNAVIHPDTGEKVVLPLRISFIIPANLVLDLGMISAYSPATTIAAQVM